jgi:hypothetical protein
MLYFASYAAGCTLLEVGSELPSDPGAWCPDTKYGNYYAPYNLLAAVGAKTNIGIASRNNLGTFPLALLIFQTSEMAACDDWLIKAR